MEGLLQQAFHVCTDCLETLRREFPQWPEAGYFLDVIQAYYAPEAQMPEILVFGTDFPAEIVHALTGGPPCYLVGGSRILADASDEAVPRDTDPVTRAALGQLFAREDMRDSALVVVPCASDAQRKVSYLLEARGWKVVTVWIPAVHSEASHRVYLSELEHAVRAICRHLGRRYSAAGLDRAAKRYASVRASIRAFTAAAQPMPGPLRMAVLDSFYMTRDLEEWQEKLDALTAALSSGGTAPQSRPRVLLAGSPIYVPNYKIPFLLLGAGLEICAYVDSNTALLERDLSGKTTLETLAEYYFDQNVSAAFVNNVALHDAIAAQVEQTHPDGVIWHVLKGQIEYDFELARNEAGLEARDLPVIRLETDYQDQDVEQLRIRMEAFAELLAQKRLEKGDLYV